MNLYPVLIFSLNLLKDADKMSFVRDENEHPIASQYVNFAAILLFNILNTSGKNIHK